MMRNSLFPCFGLRVPRHASFALAAIACLFLSGLFAAVEAQTKTAARPVARLIGATNGVASRGEVRETTARLVTTSMSNAHAARPRTARIAPTGDERRAFDLINAQRQKRGESSLVWDAELTLLAREHSRNMAERNFFNHTDPQGRNVMMRASAGGVTGWSAIAENIAYNSGYDDPAAFAVERWLISTKHRENILREVFTHSGIGVARAADGRVFFTQVFIAR